MTNQELLEMYREEVLALRELEAQIEQVGHAGAPCGCRSARLSQVRSATNDPLHATLQLQDGLEAMAAYKRETISELNPQVKEVLARIGSGKLMQLIFYYYIDGLSMEGAAERAFLALRSAQRLKRTYLQQMGSEPLCRPIKNIHVSA